MKSLFTLALLWALITVPSVAQETPELKYVLSRNKFLLQGEKLTLEDLQGKVILVASAHVL